MSFALKTFANALWLKRYLEDLTRHSRVFLLKEFQVIEDMTIYKFNNITKFGME